MKFDVIGDIHGQFQTLQRLLKKLGYVQGGGVWRHEERRALFLGDYIDRGSQPRETLHLIRAMVDAGHAVALMGNHELNAVAFHTLDARGQPLRPHTDENIKQHRATLAAFKAYPEEWAGWLEWFKGLPFFYEQPDLRAIHACWCQKSLDRVRNQTLHDAAFLARATEKETEECEALELLLKGPELDISHLGLSIKAGDKLRQELRVRWWGYDASLSSYTLPEISMPPGVNLPPKEVEASRLEHVPNLGSGGSPVFFGHYKISHEGPIVPLDRGICCLDFGAGSGGALVAYRWDGEQELNPARLVAEPDRMGPT